MARKRAADDDDDDYVEIESDDEPTPKASGRHHRHKAQQKQQQKKRPPPPSRVTPEQIIANAAAARQKHEQRRREELRAVTTEAAEGEEGEDDDEYVEIATLRRRQQPARDQQQQQQQQRVVGVKDERAEDVAADGDEHEEEEEAVEGEEDEEDEGEVAAPVVFQCGTCRSIFGDSYAFVGSNAQLLLVTLSAVTNVTASAEPQTSRDGLDAGSSFQELLCAQCQTVLGRKYVTTPVALDALRGLFSFATTAIASYQLGYPQLQATFADQSTASSSSSSGALQTVKREAGVDDAVAKALAADRKELLKLRDDMTKVQNLLLVVDERLHHLEDAQEGFVESEGEADDGPPSRRR